MGSHKSQDQSISHLNSSDSDEVNVIDPIFSQSSYASNLSQLNPQINTSPSFNPFLNNSKQTIPQNQFQMNYGFHPTTYAPHLEQQYSFQGLLNAPLYQFETQNGASSTKRKGKKQKNTSKSQAKDCDSAQPIRRNWTKEEDVALTKAWLHTSIDSLVGTDQPTEKLWSRIHQTWIEFLADDFIEDRPLSGLSKRWCVIQSCVNKFHAIYEQLMRSPQSGTDLENLKTDAHKVYKETFPNNKPFSFEHCWVECKKNAKWCTELTTNCSKRQKSNDGSSIRNDDENNDVEEIVRPPGRTTTKEKKKIQWHDKGMTDVLRKLQVSIDKQFNHNQEELELKRESVLTMKKECELREQAMKKEIELNEKEIELREQAMKKEMELKAKAQRRREQQQILNQDLSTLTPATRASLEKIQERILKEWEEEEFGI